MVRQLVLKILDVLGLRPYARKLSKLLWSSGFMAWEPLVPIPEFEEAVNAALDRLIPLGSQEPFGDYLEFGVSRGTSMACVYRVLRDRFIKGTRFIGFDSFAGMPPEAISQGGDPGGYRSLLFATRRYLAQQGVDLKRVTLIKGWFKDTLNDANRSRLAIGKVQLFMIDCHIYTATRDVLRFCAPLMPERFVIIFDDWGWQSDKGEIGQKEAFEEFLRDHPDLQVERLSGYTPQSRIFLLERSRSLR